MIVFQRIIGQVNDLLQSDNLTNTMEHQAIAEQYVSLIKSLNDKLERCYQYIERRMINEAVQFANSESPSLAIQADLLNIEKRNDFLELCEMYDWPSPPDIRKDILTLLQNSAQQIDDLSPLLNAYRKIVHTDKLTDKIKILRQLAILDSRTNEWQTTLADLENKRIQELIDSAKKLIIAKQFEQLKIVYAELSNPGWSLTVPPAVLNKISYELEVYRQQQLEEISQTHLSSINDAYGAMDFKRLENALLEYNRFITKEAFTPADEIRAQIKEAEKYYVEQKKIIDEQIHCAQLEQQLHSGIQNEAPIVFLDKIYKDLQLANYDLPESLKRTYFTYRENAISIQQRSKILRISCIVAGIAIMLAVFAGGVIWWYLSKTEKEWIQKLESSLNTSPATDTIELLKELETQSVYIFNRKSIKALEQRVQQKLKDEENTHLKFVSLVKVIQQDSTNFSKNKFALLKNKALLRQLIVNDKDKAVYEQVVKDLEKAEKDYIDGNNKKVLALMDQIKELRKSFFIAISEENVSAAEQAYDKMQHLQNQLEQSKDIAQEIDVIRQRYAKDLKDLQIKLAMENELAKKSESLMLTIKQSASIAELRRNVDKYLQEFDGRKSSAMLKNLLANLENAENIIRYPASNASENSLYNYDLEEYDKLLFSNKEMLKQLKDGIDKLLSPYLIRPEYVLILQDGLQQRKFYLGAQNGENWDFINEDKCYFKLVTGEDGKYQNCRLKLDVKTANITLYIQGESYSGKPIKPAAINYKSAIAELAPHISWLNETQENLKYVKVYQVERYLVNRLSSIIKNEDIAPYMRLKIAEQLIEILYTSDKDNTTYHKMFLAIPAIRNSIKGDFNHYKVFLNYHKLKSDMIATALKNCSNIDLQFDQHKQFQRELYAQALGRKFAIAGYASKTGNSWSLCGLKLNKKDGELIAFCPKQKRLVLIGRFYGDKIELAGNKKFALGEMQILFTPLDSNDTAQMSAALRRTAKDQNIKTITWPVSWPLTVEEK